MSTQFVVPTHKTIIHQVALIFSSFFTSLLPFLPLRRRQFPHACQTLSCRRRRLTLRPLHWWMCCRLRPYDASSSMHDRLRPPSSLSSSSQTLPSLVDVMQTSPHRRQFLHACQTSPRRRRGLRLRPLSLLSAFMAAALSTTLTSDISSSKRLHVCLTWVVYQIINILCCFSIMN